MSDWRARILDSLVMSRRLPKTIRMDNSKGGCGRVMLTWGHQRGAQLFLIEPGLMGLTLSDYAEATGIESIYIGPGLQSQRLLKKGRRRASKR